MFDWPINEFIEYRVCTSDIGPPGYKYVNVMSDYTTLTLTITSQTDYRSIMSTVTFSIIRIF